MPRRRRVAPAGYVYHVLNRAAGRAALFRTEADFGAFVRVVVETCERFPRVHLFAYCLMGNHWHLLVRPTGDGLLSEFMRVLTVTHTQRLHAHRGTSGRGPVYQGRFKSFPVETGPYFLTVARYVERNPLRANLVTPADVLDWRWSSLWARRHGDGPLRAILRPWPLPRHAGLGPGGEPAGWLARVRRPETPAELAALRRSAWKGTPWGGDRWTGRVAAQLDLGSTLRDRGRPKREPEPEEDA